MVPSERRDEPKTSRSAWGLMGGEWEAEGGCKGYVGGEAVWGGPVTVNPLSSAGLDGFELKVVTEGRKEAKRREGEVGGAVQVEALGAEAFCQRAETRQMPGR